MVDLIDRNSGSITLVILGKEVWIVSVVWMRWETSQYKNKYNITLPCNRIFSDSIIVSYSSSRFVIDILLLEAETTAVMRAG